MSSRLYSGRRVLWMPFESHPSKPSAAVTPCCGTMADALDLSCDEHDSPFECPDALFVYNEVFDEYGVVIHDGGQSYVIITHCPWCGNQLPRSARDRWFQETESLQDGDEPLPPKYLSGQWRLKAVPE